MKAGGRGFAVGIVAACLAVLEAHSASAGACLATVASDPSPQSAFAKATTENAGEKSVKATVSEVIDTRSLRLADGRVVRLAGIEPFGVMSLDPGPMEEALLSRLRGLAANPEVEVQQAEAEPDRYGRIVAMVAIDGKLLQETVAREGLAIAFASGDPLPCFERIIAAENDARENHRGFWTGGLPDARPEELDSWVSRFAIFEGKIVSVGNRRERTYLNFGYRWTEDVTAEIAAEDRELFGGEAVLQALEGQRVRVRGFIQESGGPMVVLRSPMQLEVLSGGSTTLGKAP